MVFKRIYDGVVFGNELWLGFTYYLNGVKLNRPIFEKIEDYVEITIEESLVLDDDEFETMESDTGDKITIADYKALEEKVNKLMQLLS